jgi:hypothetical protein
MTTKYCSRCKETKSTGLFGKKKTNTDGLQDWCSECTNAYYRTWRKTNTDVSTANEKKSFRNYYATLHGRAVHMHNNMRARAKRNGVQCDISIEWIETRLQTGVCEVTGIPFVFKEGTGKGHKENSFSPSIERVNPIGPYSEDNCQVTCWIYNRAKGAFPLADLTTLVNALAKKAITD